MRSLSILCMLLCLTACQDDFINSNPNNSIQDELVDFRLQPYFELFEREAKSRGHYFDLTALEITGELENIPEDNVAGTCQYGRHVSHVTVDLGYWNNSSNAFREMVVFHELGHCVLGRGHTESSFSNGICRSIMNSGTTDCFVAYNTNNRDYYLDELFENID